MMKWVTEQQRLLRKYPEIDLNRLAVALAGSVLTVLVLELILIYLSI